MKKAGVTYSNRKRRQRRQPALKLPKRPKGLLPKWVTYGATAIFAIVLCMTINFRAFTELSREKEENESLNSQIEAITSENLGLQEETYYLQNDSKTIEREAKKFGFRAKDKEKKVSVPVDK